MPITNYIAADLISAGVAASSNAVGTQPAPAPFSPAKTYSGLNTERLAGGGLRSTASGDASNWISIDATGSLKKHHVDFHSVANSTTCLLCFEGAVADCRPFTSGNSYVMWLFRGNTSSAWQLIMQKNVGGTPTSIVTTVNNAASAVASEVSLEAEATATGVTFTLTVDGTTTTYNSTDTSIRGPYVLNAAYHPTTGGVAATREVYYGVGAASAASVTSATVSGSEVDVTVASTDATAPTGVTMRLVGQSGAPNYGPISVASFGGTAGNWVAGVAFINVDNGTYKWELTVGGAVTLQSTVLTVAVQSIGATADAGTVVTANLPAPTLNGQKCTCAFSGLDGVTSVTCTLRDESDNNISSQTVTLTTGAGSAVFSGVPTARRYKYVVTTASATLTSPLSAIVRRISGTVQA